MPLLILGLVGAGLVVGAPAMIAGGLGWFAVRGRRRAYLVAVLLAIAGWAALWWQHGAIVAAWEAVRAGATAARAGMQPWLDLRVPILDLWWRSCAAAPTVAALIEAGRPRTFVEQQRAEAAVALQAEQQRDVKAAQRTRKAPEQVDGQAVLGAIADERGDARAFAHKGWAVYPPALLNRHAVVVGSSGVGKTEFLIRLAYLARKVYGWRVFYLDAKGDWGAATRFMAAMQAAGTPRLKMFPNEGFDGWRGSATEIFNRLMAVEDFSEAYYKAVTKLMLSLACHVPDGAPTSSAILLERLQLRALALHYAGMPQVHELEQVVAADARGTYSRYRGLFAALGDRLDGGWAWEDADAGYILLDGLALKEEARGLGRYLLEDFGQAMVKRIPAGEHVLLIVDEFSALAGAAEAEALFERVRSPHGRGGAGVVVTAQSYAGLGAGAERLLGAAATTVLFQCPDPERLLERAGAAVTYRKNIAGELKRSQFAIRKPVGGVTARESEEGKVHPDRVRQLPIGACYLLPSGGYQKLHVSRLVLPDNALDAARAMLVPSAGGGQGNTEEVVALVKRPARSRLVTTMVTPTQPEQPQGSATTKGDQGTPPARDL